MKESKRGKINKGTDKRLNIVINIILSFTKKNQILSNKSFSCFALLSNVLQNGHRLLFKHSNSYSSFINLIYTK